MPKPTSFHVACYHADRMLRVYQSVFDRETADQVAEDLRHKHAPTSFVVVPASKPGQLRPFAAGKMGPAFVGGVYA